jgi:hypothetical protein
MVLIEELNPELFDWLTWRNGSITNVFKIPHRTYSLIANANTLRQYAIGYCRADRVPCKPKENHVAVMFNTGEDYNWWTHLRKIEFEEIFCKNI